MRFLGYQLGAVETLITINVLAFIVTISSPAAVISSFGLQPAAVLERPWIIITSMFLHGGFFHLFANMMTLFFFGLYLENLAGERDFLKIYFLGGIVGSILFMLLSTPQSIAIGASGAVFAVGGALAVLRPHLKVMIFPLPIPLSLWVAVIGGFFIMLFLPRIAWQAHLGGLIVGLLWGYQQKKKERSHYDFTGNYG